MSKPSNQFNPRDLEFFWQISESVVSGRYLKEILQLIVTMTAEIMNSKICSILLLDEKRQELTIEATQSISQDYIKKPNIKVGESVSGRTVKERRPIAIMDVTQEKQFRYPDIARREKIVSMLSVPMMVENRVIGVINTYTPEPRAFGETEIKLLRAVANQAAVAIENTKLREETLEARKTIETRKLMNRAKDILRRRMHISEDEAHRLLVSSSRNSRKPLREVAEAVLITFSGGKKSIEKEEGPA
jgi:signal transduction protein with GAF and PtsI domain